MLLSLAVVALLGVHLTAADWMPYNADVEGVRRYDGDKVFRMIPQNEEQLKIIFQLLHAPNYAYDFWKGPTEPLQPVDLHVNVNFLTTFTGLMNTTKIPYHVTVDDVQTLIDVVDSKSVKSRAGTIVGTFPSLADLYAWMTEMCGKYPEMTTCGKAGQTYEKRDINYIRIGAKKEGAIKKKIFIEGTMHAREWLSGATIVWIIDKMLTQYSSDPTVKRLLDDYEWYFVPIANGDGYEYTRTKERMWRKTRSPSSSYCYGADPNRNWAYGWAQAGSSSNPCSDTYHGKAAFSEIEAKTLSEFILANNKDALAYFSVHCYSQMWLVPYGAGPKPADFEELLRVANIGGKALMAVNNKSWKIGNIQEVIYAAGGGSLDWAKADGGYKYSYAFELRPGPRSYNGFIVDTSEIDPSGREIWAGIVASVDAMQK
jgi:carboxypeptidase A2